MRAAGAESPGTAVRSVAAGAVAFAVLMVATACGSTTHHVAQVGSTTSTTSTRHGGGAAAFSSCVRAHGVPAYPDPSANGLVPKKTPTELGVSSSTFDAAQRACIHLLSNGGSPTAAQVAVYRAAMLRYARCIRTHGVPNMPDPDGRGHLHIGPGTPVAIDSPRFQAAYLACKKDLAP